MKYIDLLDTHLDLLSLDKYTDIPSKYFVCLKNIFKTSSRHAFKTSSRHVFKTFSRRLQDVLEDVKLLRWRLFEDVKTCLEDVLKTSSRPANVCWGAMIIPYRGTTTGKIFSEGYKMWNLIPDYIRSQKTLRSFSRSYHAYLIDNIQSYL